MISRMNDTAGRSIGHLRSLMLTAIAVLAIWAVGFAQNTSATPNFTGRWEFQTIQQPETGPSVGTDYRFLVIEHHEPRVKVTLTGADSGVSDETSLHTTDGHVNTNQIGGHEVKSRTFWGEPPRHGVDHQPRWARTEPSPGLVSVTRWEAVDNANEGWRRGILGRSRKPLIRRRMDRADAYHPRLDGVALPIFRRSTPLIRSSCRMSPFECVRTLRRSEQESADSRKEVYANPTPLRWVDPAVF